MTNAPSFAVWLTGIPASGKSTIAQELLIQLRGRDIRAVVLESDALRRILTPDATYTESDRDRFYHQLAQIGALISESGVPVIFDATANKRAYRDTARRRIARFAEILITCPIDVCIQRDPKGIYAAAKAGSISDVPGMQAIYEEPTAPDLVLDGLLDPEENARRIVALLGNLHYI